MAIRLPDLFLVFDRDGRAHQYAPDPEGVLARGDDRKAMPQKELQCFC